jgi:hypothetical protein
MASLDGLRDEAEGISLVAWWLVEVRLPIWRERLKA